MGIVAMPVASRPRQVVKRVAMHEVVLVLGVAGRAFADGPYAYSEQNIKKFHDPHAHSGHHGELSHIGSHKPEHHEGYASAYPGYEFSYKVEDHHTHDYKGQHEVRDGDVVKGMYWLIQPDGKKRTVTYHADKHSGFHAHVEYSDPDHHVYHKKEHEHHQEPEHHIKPQEHHVEHHDEHKKEGYHQKYYIKPYGYYSKVIHSKPHKHVEYHEHHEEVPKEHHVEVHEGHHEEAHKEHHEEEHKEHHEEHHIPHSDYNVHIKHPTYYSHHGNEHHHEHKSKVEEHHKEHEIKPVVEEIHEEPYKHHDGHHKVTYYDRIKKIYAHHLEKPHHEQHGEGYHNKHDDEHILYIDHKLLEELRRKAYEAFKAHEHQNHREHHGHQGHSRHHYPIHHARKYYHHIVPVSGRKHYDY